MKTKAKGFTVLELTITLAITTMVLGVIYTFFFSTNKTISTTEIKSTLQTEAQFIEEILINLGTEANGISGINGQAADHVSNNYLSFEEVTDDKDKYKKKINELILTYENNDKVIIKMENNSLSAKLINDRGQTVKDFGSLTTNIQSFKIRPLDARMVDDLRTAKFIDSPGLEFDIVLAKKKGYSDVKYDSSVIVKFRNK